MKEAVSYCTHLNNNPQSLIPADYTLKNMRVIDLSESQIILGNFY